MKKNAIYLTIKARIYFVSMIVECLQKKERFNIILLFSINSVYLKNLII